MCTTTSYYKNNKNNNNKNHLEIKRKDILLVRKQQTLHQVQWGTNAAQKSQKNKKQGLHI